MIPDCLISRRLCRGVCSLSYRLFYFHHSPYYYLKPHVISFPTWSLSLPLDGKFHKNRDFLPLSFRIESPAPKTAWAHRKFLINVEKFHPCCHIMQIFLFLRLKVFHCICTINPIFFIRLSVDRHRSFLCLGYWGYCYSDHGSANISSKPWLFKIIFIYLFIFGWVRSSLQQAGATL